jgi:hypothetical protein
MTTLLAPLKVAALSLLLIAGLAACKTDSTETPEADAREETSEPATVENTPSTPLEQYAEGELRNVDLTAKTFMLRETSGLERKFNFSDTTRVTGIPNTQGLSGKQGSRARVGYLTQGDLNSATWIEIVTPIEPAQK